MKCSGPCGKEIKRGTKYWSKVTGYEAQRDQGGTNAIALPDRSAQEFICDTCMISLKARRNIGQGALL